MYIFFSEGNSSMVSWSCEHTAIGSTGTEATLFISSYDYCTICSKLNPPVYITLVKVLLPQSHIQNNGINLWGGSIPASSLSLLAIQMHTNQELLSVNLSNGRDLLPPASSLSCVTHQVMSKSLQTKYLRIVIGKAKSKPEYIDDLSCFNYENNSLKNSVFV